MPDQSYISERRKHHRANLSLPVRFSWYSFSDKKVMSTRDYHGTTKNLGQKGISFITEDPPPKGAFLELEISCPKDHIKFEALASVIWIEEVKHSDKCEVGAEIFAMDDSGRQHIDKCLGELDKGEIKESQFPCKDSDDKKEPRK